MYHISRIVSLCFKVAAKAGGRFRAVRTGTFLLHLEVTMLSTNASSIKQPAQTLLSEFSLSAANETEGGNLILNARISIEPVSGMCH